MERLAKSFHLCPERLEGSKAHLSSLLAAAPHLFACFFSRQRQTRTSIAGTARSTKRRHAAMSGRKTGSKNKPGHSAGGFRANAGRKSKADADRIAEEKRRKAEQEAARKAADRNKRAKVEERKRKQRDVRRERMEKQTRSRLRRSARLQQQHDEDILCRQDEHSNDGDDEDVEDDDDCNGTNDDELDEDNDNESDDEEDYATEEGRDDATKERRKRRRNKYMPPPDSPLGQHLDQFQRDIAGISNRKKLAMLTLLGLPCSE